MAAHHEAFGCQRKEERVFVGYLFEVLVRHMDTGKSASDNVFGARDVVKGWIVFFEEEMPAENTLSCVSAAELVGEVFMISVDMKDGTKKH